jgi:hypothetical protein
MNSAQRIDVFVEAGRKRVFASAVDWPGWARSGKTEELAIAALATYRPRYEVVARRAGLASPVGELVVAERLSGLAKLADFGALSAAAASEEKPIGAEEGHRLAALLGAAWAEFDAAASMAPDVLPKGPRGGGRDTGAIVDHVAETEAMHAAKLGIKLPKPKPTGDAATAWLRSAMLKTLRAGIDGSALGRQGGWPPRYFVRRSGWHLLDHAWELQDKSGRPHGQDSGPLLDLGAGFARDLGAPPLLA